MFQKQQTATAMRKAPEDRIWFVRRAIPKDLWGRARFGARKELIKSLGTSDLRLAERERGEIWRQWTSLFNDEREAARSEERGVRVYSRDEVAAAIDAWRSERCRAAAEIAPIDVGPINVSAHEIAGSGARAMGELLKDLEGATFKVDLLKPSPRKPDLAPDLRTIAERYFDERPDASREIAPAPSTVIRLGKLQKAGKDPAGWLDIDGFDAAYTSALASQGVSAAVSIIEDTRQQFARAWWEVERHEEAERARAAAYLAAAKRTVLDPSTMQVAMPVTSYLPRDGDRTVADLIDAYRVERGKQHGSANTDKRYSHIFKALTEALGAETPIRSLMRSDLRDVRDLLQTLPKHMSKMKIYDGLSLREAAKMAADTDAALLAPNTVNTYIAGLTAIFGWAVSEDWIEKNPASKLSIKSQATVQRRGFTAVELHSIFDPLANMREEHPWRFWIPALALYSGGARLGELCQLRVSDVRYHDEIAYLALTEFDSAGDRESGKYFKTASSQRNVPIHPDLIASGFLEYVNKVKEGRLFPELNLGADGRYTRKVTRFFADHLEGIKLSDPALVFHSFRHLFRTACDVAGVSEERRLALGGWSARSVGNKYGDRQFVPVLYADVASLKFGDFAIADVVARHGRAIAHEQKK